MEISTKEDAILIILKELDTSHEKVIRMYFGLGTDPKSSIEEIGQDLDLTTDAVIELKNEGIREFIKLIVSTGIFFEIRTRISQIILYNHLTLNFWMIS